MLSIVSVAPVLLGLPLTSFLVEIVLLRPVLDVLVVSVLVAVEIPVLLRVLVGLEFVELVLVGLEFVGLQFVVA